MFKHLDAFLVGYYGMQNCGDDALLLATHFGARKHLQCNKIAVSSMRDIKLCDDLQIAKTLRKTQNWRGQNRVIQYRHALASKRVIFGGGSVFHNATDINQKRHLIKLAGQKRSQALGVSLGPFKDTQAEQACAKFLREVGFVAVRDQQSYDIAKAITPDCNVKLSFDLAVSLCKHPQFKVNQGPRQGILFNVCPVAKDAFGNTDPFEEEQRARDLSQVIEALWRRTGERITLINFNGHAQLGDGQLTKLICEQLRGRVPVSTIPYNSNPLKVMQVISHFKVMVSMRLHGNVFAYMSKTPSIALNYHPKCEQWCEQIGLPQAMRFDINQFSKRGLFNAIEQGLETGFPMAQLPVETATERSEANWSKQDEQPKFFSRHPALQ
ncbi:polysaccharide pyruvyl transferase family protein [Planctobacterium marinum]|uniref:Polysaccharide pyruvyl transferase domain-containing protein n=1 Tax=Planctobacterium marinum TaxID=1631968 RepID=A0AA48KW76_9ALTE|nr:hypothetical protein MACH26_37760 [Planctobacterium marinum]